MGYTIYGLIYAQSKAYFVSSVSANLSFRRILL